VLWMGLVTKDEDHLRALVNMVMNLQVSCATCGFSRTQLRGVSLVSMTVMEHIAR
jgi:hypothetical protein